jgi:hypothetical protein
MEVKRMINRLLFGRRLEKQIKLANKWHKLDGYAYMVVMWQGKPRVFRKQKLKDMIKSKKFVKGTTIQKIEQKSLYKTY